MAVNVNYANENMSRQALLSWVNDKLSSKILKIEDLCSGIAYCQLLDQLFPGMIPMKRVKTTAQNEYNYIVNFKILQEAFNKLSIQKVVPVDKLVKGRFQDNFEFIQWFKKFYDANSVQPLNGNKSKCKNSSSPVSNGKEPLKTMQSPVDCPSTSEKDFGTHVNEEALLDQLKNLEDQLSKGVYARDFYLSKINLIEKICLENEDDPFTRKVLELLCKRDGSPDSNLNNAFYQRDGSPDSNLNNAVRI